MKKLWSLKDVQIFLLDKYSTFFLVDTKSAQFANTVAVSLYY